MTSERDPIERAWTTSMTMVVAGGDLPPDVQASVDMWMLEHDGDPTYWPGWKDHPIGPPPGAPA
jgi:hypothetical protein